MNQGVILTLCVVFGVVLRAKTALTAIPTDFRSVRLVLCERV
jgi:hypothetical protein